MFKISFAVLCITSLSLITMIRAQDAPNDYVQAHNAARAAAGVGPVTWDDKVVAFAKNYASQHAGDCNLVHSTNRSYGENLAVSSGDFSGTQALKLRVDEKSFYDYGSNSCPGGKMCLHYTQVVWRNSVRIGCANVRCSNGGTFISCNYDPPGNFNGHLPY